MSHLIINADSRQIPLADQSVHCVVTSPPYWSLRDYGVSGQVGLESTPEDYIANLVDVFREVRRVLRDDGVCWLNLGDTYALDSKWGGSPGWRQTAEIAGAGASRRRRASGLRDGNLIGIPWRVALALQDDGWILRAEVIWSKRSPMPESVKTRPTRSHEQVFLLTKSQGYFYDWFAVTEKATQKSAGNGYVRPERMSWGERGPSVSAEGYERRNLRTVWTLSSHPFKGGHFAAFPPKLVIPCVKAGTSEHGCCPRCGAQWVREVKKERVPTRPAVASKVYLEPPVNQDSPVRSHAGDICGNRDPQRHVTRYVTAGWNPGCECGESSKTPAVVLDPFGGAGTTPLVAESLGRVGLATELSHEYCLMAEERIRRPHKPRQSHQQADGTMPLFEG